ncbi:MAG: DUF3181 family protein [Halothece sp.]
MTYTNTSEMVEALASDIGANVYMDIAKWHLYLSDAHLAFAIAERVYPMLENRQLDESKVIEMLEEIPVVLGGGKRQVPLIDMLPTRCQVNLMDLLEEYQRKI